jgi:N-acetylmuramoyl-L-alanine amidase
MPSFSPDSAFVRRVLVSPNHDARGRSIDMVVLHYTGMRSTDAALKRLCDPAARVSSHYVVLEDGEICQLVPEAERAWHAGVSSWEGATDVNARSIGIEIANPGHDLGYPDFPDAQIAAVIALCRDLILRRGIAAARVLAHSDVAPARKPDPGEKFPWRQLADAGIGIWVEPT